MNDHVTKFIEIYKIIANISFTEENKTREIIIIIMTDVIDPE